VPNFRAIILTSKVYLDDSMGQKTYAYDFDLETGGISNKRVLIDFSGTCGEPDGMVIDSENNLWIAVYGSNRVSKLYASADHLATCH
jgi:sugar lactone lactonase YvrE